MTTVEMLSRKDAQDERERVLEELPSQERDELRSALMAGALDSAQVVLVERLQTLDYLLDE